MFEQTTLQFRHSVKIVGIVAAITAGTAHAPASEIGWELPTVPNALGPVEGDWAGANNGQAGADFRANPSGYGTTDGAVYEIEGKPFWYSMHQDLYNASLTDAYGLNEWSRRHDYDGAAVWTIDHDTFSGKGDVYPRHEARYLRVAGPDEEGHGGETGRQMVLMFRAPHAGTFTLDIAGKLSSTSSTGSTYGRFEVFKINDALDVAESIDIIYTNISGGLSPGSTTTVSSFDEAWDITLAEGERIGVRFGLVAGANSITGGRQTLIFDKFQIIPEPSAMMLIGVPTALLLLRRPHAGS